MIHRWSRSTSCFPSRFPGCCYGTDTEPRSYDSIGKIRDKQRDADEIAWLRISNITKYSNRSTGIIFHAPVHVLRVTTCASLVGSKRNDSNTERYTTRERTKTIREAIPTKRPPSSLVNEQRIKTNHVFEIFQTVVFIKVVARDAYQRCCP